MRDSRGAPRHALVLCALLATQSFDSIKKFICYTLDGLMELGKLYGEKW